MLDLLVRCLSYEWSDYWHVNIVCQVFCSSDWRVCVKCIHSKTSLGSDLVAADHATLHHMTFLALLAVCEDTILHEWIGSEMYHFKICDAPINTKMFRYLLLDHIAALTWTWRHSPKSIFETSWKINKIDISIFRICQQDKKNTHTFYF